MPSPIRTMGKLETFKRPVPGDYVKGAWVPSADPPTNMKAWASIQALSPRDSQVLQEGREERQGIRIYVEGVEPIATDEKAQTTGDVWTWQGRDFEVMKFDPWPQLGLKHWKAFAFLIDPNKQTETDPST